MWPKWVSNSLNVHESCEIVTISKISCNDGNQCCILNYINCYWLLLKVRENRAQREAERQRQQREREAQRDAREEAKRRVGREETMKKKEAQRQEEMLQQEMVRLRRQMEERRPLEQLVRQRYPQQPLASAKVASLKWPWCLIEYNVIFPASPSYGLLNGSMVTYWEVSLWWASSLTQTTNVEELLWVIHKPLASMTRLLCNLPQCM